MHPKGVAALRILVCCLLVICGSGSRFTAINVNGNDGVRPELESSSSTPAGSDPNRSETERTSPKDQDQPDSPSDQGNAPVFDDAIQFPTMNSPTMFPIPFPESPNRTKTTFPPINLFDSKATPNGSFPGINVSETLAALTPEFPRNAKEIKNEKETQTTTNDKGVPIRITTSRTNDGKPKVTTEVIHPAERPTPEIITDHDSEAPDSDYSDGPGPELPSSTADTDDDHRPSSSSSSTNDNDQD